ncbi:MAG: porin family protein [Bacteroidota bacterium]
MKAQQFEGGMLGGLDFCQVDGDTYSGYNKLGGLAGAYIRLPISPKWSFRMEMEFIAKGSVNHYNPNAIVDSTSGNVEYKNSTSYIEVPFLLEYNLKPALANKVSPDYLSKIKVFGGVSLGALMSHKEIIDYVETNGIYPGFSTLNLNMVFGLQYLLSQRLTVDYRWDISLTSIRSSPWTGYVRRFGSKGGQYNNLMALSLMYKL